MKKDLCELIVILDESGSMCNVKNDTIGGFNTFLETHQKLPGEALLTLIKFDSEYDIVHNGVDVRSVEPLNKDTYTPGGMTALLDAVGRAIDEVGKRYDNAKEEEKPGKVIFLITTDGEENSSKEYKLEAVKEKIQRRQTENEWEFIFMGANQDAWRTGGSMGIASNVNYVVDDISKTMKGAAYYSSNFRLCRNKVSLDNFNLSEEELDKELDKITKNADKTETDNV